MGTWARGLVGWGAGVSLNACAEAGATQCHLPLSWGWHGLCAFKCQRPCQPIFQEIKRDVGGAGVSAGDLYREKPGWVIVFYIEFAGVLTLTRSCKRLRPRPFPLTGSASPKTGEAFSRPAMMFLKTSSFLLFLYSCSDVPLRFTASREIFCRLFCEFLSCGNIG